MTREPVMCARLPPLGGLPGHVPGICDQCHRGSNTRRGLCAACYRKAMVVAEQPKLTSVELVYEVIHCGSRDPGDLAEALGFTRSTLAKRLRRIANRMERKNDGQ